MTENSSITVFAPASIGNFGVGFDILGAAIAPIDETVILGDTLRIAPAAEQTLTLGGRFAHQLPELKQDNLVWKAAERFHAKLQAEKKDHSTATLSFHLNKDVPVSGGLGSSACSLVATVYGLNEYHQRPFSIDEVIELCGELESENSGGLPLDNIAPILLGGMQLIVGDSAPYCQPIPYFKQWYLSVCYPGVTIPTKTAREVLPEQVSLNESLLFSQRLSAFVDALYRHDPQQALRVFKDELIEPHRAALLPCFEDCKTAALNAGALGFALSGSGSTVFAICDEERRAKRVARLMAKACPENDDKFYAVCQVVNKGVRKVS